MWTAAKGLLSSIDSSKLSINTAFLISCTASSALARAGSRELTLYLPESLSSAVQLLVRQHALTLACLQPLQARRFRDGRPSLWPLFVPSPRSCRRVGRGRWYCIVLRACMSGSRERRHHELPPTRLSYPVDGPESWPTSVIHQCFNFVDVPTNLLTNDELSVRAPQLMPETPSS